MNVGKYIHVHISFVPIRISNTSTIASDFRFSKIKIKLTRTGTQHNLIQYTPTILVRGEIKCSINGNVTSLIFILFFQFWDLYCFPGLFNYKILKGTSRYLRVTGEVNKVLSPETKQLLQSINGSQLFLIKQNKLSSPQVLV